MGERYFLALLAIVSSLAALWIGVSPAIMASEFIPAVLVAFLGLVALTNVSNRRVSSLMIVFFLTSLVFTLYIYLTTYVVSLLLVNMAIVNLVGLIVGFAMIQGKVQPHPAPAKAVDTKKVSKTARKKKKSKAQKK